MRLSTRTVLRPLLTIILVSAIEVPSAMAQATINVPGSQPTIQAAINAAANGDTVLVAPGKYTENIDFKGKAITVTSSAGPTQTTIDGGQNGVVVTFQSSETRSSILNGFTITDNAPPYPVATHVVAAGILVSGANPTITGNIITNNRGYGIEVIDNGASIRGNTISNTLTAGDPSQDFGCDFIDGSGIYIQGGNGLPGQVEIANNLFEYNTARCYGGAIYYDLGSSEVIISNNTFRYNVALGPGGAIFVYSSLVSFVQNLFIGNTSGAAGGAIDLQIPNDTNDKTGPLDQFLVNNTFVGNTINPNMNIAGFYADGSQVAFEGYVSQVGFFNNIFVSGDEYGQIACNPIYSYLSSNPPILSNNDSLNFGGPRAGGWCPDQTGTSANISANPMFITANSEPFHLQTGSPAEGVGDVAAQDLPSQDLDGNSRTQNGKVDLGVYEGAVGPTGTSVPPSFSISSSQTSITIPNGQPAQTILTISPTGGFIGTLSLNCPASPSGIECVFSPPVLAAGGDNQQITSTLTISAPLSGASLSAPPVAAMGSTRGDWFGLVSLLALPCIAVCCSAFLAAARHRSLTVPRTVAAMTIMTIAFFAESCGGGSQALSAPSPPSNTQSATLGITVNSSGNAAISTRTLSLPVTIDL